MTSPYWLTPDIIRTHQTKQPQYLLMSSCVNIMKFCLFFILLVGVYADSYEDGLYKDAIGIIKECGSRPLSLCLKEKALQYIERLPNNLVIGNGIRIKQNDERISKHTPITLPNGTTAREAILDQFLLERISDYLISHTLEIQIPGNISENLVEEGRKKKGKGGKKGGSMLPLLMMFKLKAATLGALALKIIGLVAFKALLMAKVAFTIATILALKKGSEHKHHTSTYEVVAHPHFEDHDHYDRSLNSHL